jgi:3-hydroxybutyryl-CoA dehydrogenase
VKNIEYAMVVGAGTMGHGFAQIFALNDVSVTLVDTSHEILNRARGWIEDNLNFMVELGELDASRVAGVLSQIDFTTELDQAARRAQYVLEAVHENLELKLKVFAKLDAATTSETILATNTSSFDVNELSMACKRPDRFIGTHWFHPPPITPCVEIIPAETTSELTIDRTVAFMERIGKVPTLCKSAPGFVANRIQLAMAAEALALVEEGLATPAEIDRIVKTSFGFRLGAYGPFEIMDQAGSDTYRAVYEYLYGKLRREQFKPSPVLEKMISEKRFGMKSGAGFYEYANGAAEAMKRDRDRKFYARLALFRQEQRLKVSE